MARTGPSFVRFIESITIDNEGNGYSSSDAPSVYIGSPNLTTTEGDKVQATATVAIVGSKVDSITITNPGDGYVTAPMIKLMGSLTTVSYTAQPNVNRGEGTFTNVIGIPTNGGTGALFTVVVDATGAVTSVTVTTAGSNYVEGEVITIPDTNIGGTGNAPDITLTVATISGGGSGAVLTPSINLLNRPQQYFHQNFSYVIDSQIPEWIRNEYPTYTAFIKKYFEFLDADDDFTESIGTSTISPNYLLQELLDRFSVSHYHSDFLDDLLSQYGIDFPSEKEIDTRYLIKQLREFYTSKGSQESIKTLFRILYNEDIEIFKPSEFILKPSDGIYNREVTVKVYENDEYLPIYNPLDLRGRSVSVYYYESSASLTTRKHINTSVLRAKKIAYTNPSAYELTLNIPAETVISGYGVEGELSAVIGGKISTITNIGAADVLRSSAGSPYTIGTSDYTTDGNGSGAEFTVTVDGSGAASVTIDTVGDDFAPGETITIADADLGGGGAADLTFDVDEITEGKIFSVTIDDAGQGYSANPLVIILPDDNDTITTEASITTRLTDESISSTVITESGVGYNNVPTLALNILPVRTYIGFENTLDEIENKKAFLTRVLNNVTITSDSGAADGGFKVGDTFKVNETGDILGIYAIDYFDEDYTITGISNNAFVRVNTVDADNYPTSIEIVATGVGFQRKSFNFTLTSSNSETTTLACTTGFSHTYPGQFKNSKGFLSDGNKLQNNALYSPYAYQVQSSLPKSRWNEYLKRTAHPAGMEVFSDLQILQTIDFSADFNIIPDVFIFYKIFLEEFTVNDSAVLLVTKPASDSIDLNDTDFILSPNIIKFETPAATDDVDKFDVTLTKSETPDMSELVAKDITKPTITDSVDMSEVVVILLQILRNPTDSVDMSETVVFVIELNKTENPTVDDNATFDVELTKTETPTVDDNDVLEVELTKTDSTDMSENVSYLYGSNQSEDYTVSDAGQLIIQDYAGDYFAEDYVGEARNF